ncbi:MAG: YcxB family protein [Lachnospiraceae bacterium]|nr:YcxB family protein [Lachnospiraceae bacterium]
MTAAKTKTVKMNFKALYSYVINTNYRSPAGIVGLLVSIICLGLLIAFWSKVGRGYKIMLLLVGLTFTVINPLMLAWQTFKQLKLSPSYRKPLNFTFTDDGITVSQEDVSQDISWDKVCRIMMTGSMIAIYTGRMHAFVIPLSQLGEDRSKIISSVVQFTMQYKPRLSGNLKEYQSGKGI